MAYFSGTGLFSTEKANAGWADIAIHPQNIIKDIYSSTWQSALIRSEGNQREADYLMDCSYFDYYLRCAEYNKYCEWNKEQMENSKNK